MSDANNTAAETYTLGGYEIIGTAGAGGMGVVYKGIDPALGRLVAIKVLKDELRAHPAVVARFRREAEAIATLSHPNIVRIFAIGDTDALPYIVMEFVDGQPLSESLMETGSLPWEEALDIGIQVADALSCAHECQVIHRDIKPANILIAEDGTVKVTDFGIAKVLNASTQLTVDGARIGTPQYMCPERCKNMPATHSSDLYSLGVMLFQSITGRLPYDAANSAELIGKIAYEVPKRIRAFKPEVPEAVDRLVAYLLEKDAENRPPDARALRKMIERIRRGETLSDELPALDVALETVRAETPLPGFQGDTTSRGSATRHRGLGSRWYAVPRAVRVLFAVSMLAFFSAGGYFFIRQQMTPISLAVYNKALLRDDISRWTQRPSLADFTFESKGVIAGTIELKDFRIAQLDWIGGADGAVVLLQGITDSSRDGQMALLTINPYLRQVNVSLPPMAAGVAPQPRISLIGTGAYRSDTPGMILSTAAGTYFLSTTPGATPDRLVNWPAQAALFSDTEGTVILARTTVQNGTSPLLSTRGEHGGGVPAEFSIQGNVVEMATHAASGQLAVLSQNESSLSLSVAMVNYPDEKADVVREGNLAMSRRPFSPSGGKVTFIEFTEGGEGQAVVQSLYNRQDTQSMGAAYDVLWVPNSDDLILMAPDHAGRHQLWAVSSNDRESRRQLTFVDTGMGESVAISDDGHCVLAARPDSNAFVIVELSPVDAQAS